MSRSRRVLTSGLGLFLLAAASPSFANTTINTIPAWDGSSEIHPFGPPNTQTYGQVVTVPGSETSLSSFTFVINDEGNTIPFLAEVYAWDGVNLHATGASLFESGTMTTSGSNTYQQFTVTIPGGVTVTPGQQYVLFLTTSKSTQASVASEWAAVPIGTYSGGRFVFINNGTDTSQWTGASWSLFGSDLAFSATFGGSSGPAALNIPTLGGTMLAVFAAALALAGVGVLRFRHG